MRFSFVHLGASPRPCDLTFTSVHVNIRGVTRRRVDVLSGNGNGMFISNVRMTKDRGFHCNDLETPFIARTHSPSG